MNYSTTKKVRKIKDKVIDILLFPLRCICTPIYKLLQKIQKDKRYSEKQIRKAVQYLIDYWSDKEDEFYIILDDDYNPFDYGNISTPFHMGLDMSWGWSGENKRMKNRVSHIYHCQKEQYLNMFKELCGTPMSWEDKKKSFDSFNVYKIENRVVCKIK